MANRQNYNVSVNSIKKTIANSILQMCKLPRYTKVYKHGKIIGYRLSQYSKDVYSLKMSKNDDGTEDPVPVKVHAKGDPRLKHIVTKAQYIKYFQKPIRKAVATATHQVIDDVINRFNQQAQSDDQQKPASNVSFDYRGCHIIEHDGHYFMLNNGQKQEIGDSVKSAKQFIDQFSDGTDDK